MRKGILFLLFISFSQLTLSSCSDDDTYLKKAQDNAKKRTEESKQKVLDRLENTPDEYKLDDSLTKPSPSKE